jgi:PAS domain S-box-containing protein
MAQRPIRDELKQKIREAEDALRESETKYRNLVERAQDGIVILHREKLVYVNPYFAKLTGYQVGELEGRSATIIIPPELQEPLRERYKRRLKGENELTIYESQLMHRERRRIDVEFNIGVIRYRGEPANLTIVRDITERKRIEKERIQAEKRLRYLSSRLLKSQESERKRLSKELHDELGQSLALLKHMLRSANRSNPGPSPSPETSIDETITFVDQIIESLRRISKDLSPAILEDLGLTAALQWALDTFSRKHAIETFFQMADIDNLYSAEVKVNIYRIIQESLNNIGKHARAERVSVTARRKKGSVSFTVEDDGRGFELGRVKKDNLAGSGMGLDIMTERAHMIGASLEIESAPGKGTRIRLHVPSRIHL